MKRDRERCQAKAKRRKHAKGKRVGRIGRLAKDMKEGSEDTRLGEKGPCKRQMDAWKKKVCALRLQLTSMMQI